MFCDVVNLIPPMDKKSNVVLSLHYSVVVVTGTTGRRVLAWNFQQRMVRLPAVSLGDKTTNGAWIPTLSSRLSKEMWYACNREQRYISVEQIFQCHLFPWTKSNEFLFLVLLLTILTTPPHAHGRRMR